jgi:hypothetical protein
MTLLMEWQDPQARVIVHHAQPALTLLAAVRNASLTELGRSQLEELASGAGLQVVRQIAYDGPMQDLPAWVDRQFAPGGDMSMREGVVCVLEDEHGQPLARVRVKGEWYRLQHAMRFEVNVYAVARAWDKTQRRSPKGKAAKRKRSADPVQAVCDELRVSHQSLVRHVARTVEALQQADGEVEAEWTRLVELHRKTGDTAPATCRRLGLDAIAAAAFKGLDGRSSRARSRLVEGRRAQLLAKLAC